jgi:two-component system, cell cycle sensor histidine kinase and response regulator CckA
MQRLRAEAIFRPRRLSYRELVLEAEPMPSGGHETILLVEDDPLIRKLATRVLAGLGYTVLQAENGLLAMEVVRSYGGEIMLLLSDVVMPLMNGQALAERLLVARPGLKVLYVSGYTDNVVVRQEVQDRSVAFLQKPYTPSSLARKVRDVLDSVSGSPL